jgi:hypothetical protein
MEYKLGIGKAPSKKENEKQTRHVMLFDEDTGELVGVREIRNYSEALMECM